MKKFIIDRSKWRSGVNGSHATGCGHTRLLNNFGYMCCLGQIMAQEGFKENQLMAVNRPDEVYCEQKESVCLFDEVLSTFASGAMKINDNYSLDLEVREKALCELADEHGIELEFSGEPVKNSL